MDGEFFFQPSTRKPPVEMPAQIREVTDCAPPQPLLSILVTILLASKEKTVAVKWPQDSPLEL